MASCKTHLLQKNQLSLGMWLKTQLSTTEVHLPYSQEIAEVEIRLTEELVPTSAGV